MRQSWKAGARDPAWTVLVIALLIGMGSGLFHVGQALAGTTGRRADMLMAGVDMMPVGTAKQVDRLKRFRMQKP